jgi:hypothetical protein
VLVPGRARAIFRWDDNRGDLAVSTKRGLRWLAMAWVSIGGITGCAAQTQYRPTEEVAGVLDGALAARYPLPPESPRGDVNIASMGLVSVRHYILL